MIPAMRALLGREALKGLLVALVCALIVALLDHLGVGVVVGVLVFAVLLLVLVGRQVPSDRINGRRVRVLWGLDEPRPGRVVRWINMDRGRVAEVLLDGEAVSILVPLSSLEFPWYERIRHYLPVRLAWGSAPE
jgi:hypothetical protein